MSFGGSRHLPRSTTMEHIHGGPMAGRPVLVTGATAGIERASGYEPPVRHNRVLIVDDHLSFRSVARQVLTADGFLVVGEAADGAEAIRACGELRPDLVLLAVQLPDIDGFAVASGLTSL